MKYKWRNFKVRKDKWGLLLFYLVFLLLSAAVSFAAIYQNAVMDLHKVNRIFYMHVMKNEKMKKEYQELDSLIHTSPFVKVHWLSDD